MQKETLFQLWRGLRAESVTAVKEFPAEAMDTELAPGFLSFRKLNRHILESSQVLTGLLLEGWEHFNTPALRERFATEPHTVPADVPQEDLAAALESALERRIAEMDAQPAAFWEREVTYFSGARISTMDMCLLIRTHEAEHRAQAAVLSRLQGIVPATTRKRQSAAKA